VKFADLDQITVQTAGAIARAAETVRQAILEALGVDLADVAATGDGTAVLARLRQLLSSTTGATLPGAPAAVDAAARAALVALEAAYSQAAQQIAAEAARQGLPEQLLPDVANLLPTRGERQTMAEWARRATEHPLTRTLQVAYDATARAVRPGRPVDGFTALEAALGAAEDASTAGTEDLARQAAGQAHGAGRARAARETPIEPKEIYASELLDSDTCGPCATVDGRTYDSMASALVDYPSAGGFRGCLGGARCRGTLVFVWPTESDPTLPTAGDGRSPNEAPPDRTPQGPIDLPTAPEPPSNTPAVLDPAFDPKPPPAEPLNPLALSDADLDQAIEDAMAREDYAAAEQLAAEQDARAQEQGVVSVWDEAEQRQDDMWTTDHDVDSPDVAGDVVDDWDDAKPGDQRESDGDLWEFNPAYGWQLVGKAGKASKAAIVERVKADWDEYLWAHQSEAEAATRGQLLRNDRRQEFINYFGSERATSTVLFTGPANRGYYFASRELRDFWESHPRITYAEFAVERGLTDPKLVEAAAKAPGAREDARTRAEEDQEKRQKRQREASARRKRRQFTEGTMDQ
jgi:hypothetical protein